MRTLIGLLLALVTLPAFCEVAHPPGQAVIITARRMIDGRSDTVIADAVVLVQDGKIQAVGRRGALNLPDVERIDLGDVTLLPGLIDAHVHLLLQGDVTTEDYDVQLFKESLAYRALRASHAAKVGLEHGFTTMRDLETEGAMYTDVDVKRAIENGVIPGPRLFVSTRALSVTGGYGPSGYAPDISFPMGVQIVDGVDEARKAVREQIAHGADWIKVYADRSYFLQKDGTLSSIPTFTPEEMKAIVDEAHRLRHKVAAHAMARPGIENALNAGVDSIEHGTAMPDDLIDLMIAKGIYYCPTLTVTEFVAPGRAAEGRAIWTKMPAFHHDSFARALRKGAKIVMGTDVGGFPWDAVNEAKEFEYETKYGMTAMQAIRSGTIVAAQLLDQEDRIGTIERGKLADLVAVPGNPLDDITVLQRVSFVMKGGVVIKK